LSGLFQKKCIGGGGFSKIHQDAIACKLEWRRIILLIHLIATFKLTVIPGKVIWER
jgi:hypothetical protein